MTELEAYRGARLDDGHLIAWAESARAAAGIAKSLARTPFVPATLRDRDNDITVGNITAAILTGTELGLTPMAALRSIDVIQGTPTLRAIALRALVLSAGHELVVDESTKTRAIVRGRRRGSDEWQRSVWTIDRARDYGVAGNDNWRKQPTAMLIARATAECARLIAADVLLAIPYIAEEIQDEGTIVAPDVAPPARKRTAQRRRAVEAPPSEPVTHDEPPTLEGDDPANARPVVDLPLPDDPLDDDRPPRDPPPPKPITRAQSRMLHAVLNEIGTTDRDEYLALIGGIVGRDLTSTNELNTAEASVVIDDLAHRANHTEDEP